MTHGAPGGFGGLDAQQQLFQRRLRFDDDGVGAGVDQRLGLLVEGIAHLRFREIAVGFHQSAEGADVADDVAVADRQTLRGRCDGRPD